MGKPDQDQKDNKPNDLVIFNLVVFLIIMMFLFLVISWFLLSHYQDEDKEKFSFAREMYQVALKEAGNGSSVEFDFEGIHLEINPILNETCNGTKK